MEEIRNREGPILEKEHKIEEKNETENSEEKCDEIVVDSTKGFNIHAPITADLDFSKLQGLNNIHIHLHQK